nr:efflux RND transporter periplasmic adaptor subunit [Jannaschia seosinensis]
MAAAGAVAQDAPPPTVTVETLEPQSVTLTSTLPGRVHASSEAEVRPQVSGIVTERLFEEGGEVEAGALLYRIDPVSYEAAVAQAQASVAQAEAQLRAAEREAERVQTLSERGITSASSEDDATAARDAAAAALEAARAGLRTADIELDRTEIRARLSGRIGFSEVSEGALVTASQAMPLTVIRTLDPVHVDVTQSAADLLAWRRREGPAANGQRDVSLTLADGSIYEVAGQLSAAEPLVDEKTGVVVLRMSFPNPDGLLLPGMYVQVEMPTGTAGNVFLVPQEGVSRDRRGNPTALVVNAENVVESRDLSVLQDRGTDWIVDGGLESGDRVIVAGLQKIAPGATVTPEERQDPQKQASVSVDGQLDVARTDAATEAGGQ